VSGIYRNEFVKGILLDTATVDPHLERITDVQLLLKTKSGPSAKSQRRLEQALGDNPAIQVQDKKEIAQSNARFIDLLLTILYAMLGMAVLIAVLGVVNTLVMSVFERSQEIGMLRAVGLDRDGVRQMVRLESVAISFFGGVLGVALGAFIGWATGDLVASMGLPLYSLVLPWLRMGLFLALAVVVGLLAALWPARRAAGLDVLDAVTGA
jgi:putative ABC transport system permease protein